MQKAIEVLMGEHRLIEQALGSLETYAVEVRAGAPALGEVIADYARFFSGFADRCHHGGCPRWRPRPEEWRRGSCWATPTTTSRCCGSTS